MSVARSSSSFIVGGDAVDVLDTFDMVQCKNVVTLSPPKLISIPTYVERLKDIQRIFAEEFDDDGQED